MTHTEILEKIFDAFAKDEATLLTAKQEWMTFSDLVHAAHDSYEEQSDAFLEWLSFERLDDQGLTFLDRVLQSQPSGFSKKDLPWMLALRSSHHSLFQIKVIDEKGLTLTDLFGNGSFFVTERRRLVGLNIGDIFEARVFPHPEEDLTLLFSKTFLLHPSDAVPSILKSVSMAKQKNEPKQTVLGKLQRLRLRCADYKHLSQQRIYEKGAMLSP